MPVIPVMFMEPGVCHPYVHWRDVAGVAVKLAKCFFKVVSFEMFHDMLSCADDSVSIYQLGEGHHKVGHHGKAQRREGAILPCYRIMLAFRLLQRPSACHSRTVHQMRGS